MTRSSATVAPRRNYARWRAASLILVHLLIAAHIVHWKLAGRTLAPLELNEVMYTLELGIVTAGFLFMVTATLATLIFGRFFCSWGCHILALQDGSAWILRKLHIRPKPIRSRALLLVPIGAVLYMFVWPQLRLLLAGEPAPALHVRADSEGWASFITEDFWRNLPPVWVALLTFAVCGFAAVYVLGSRGFCTYGCPYGALFGLAERFAPGTIRVNEDCEQCARCTAVCTSQIRVHEEVRDHGMVVNPACLRDMDCVAACPKEALRFGFGKPALFRSAPIQGRFGVRADYSWAEEGGVALVFIVSLFVLRGLYDLIPFLMALALGGIIACGAVAALRLRTRADVRFLGWRLKTAGKIRNSGQHFIGVMLSVGLLLGHSGVIRWHESTGWKAVAALRSAEFGIERDARAERAWSQLRVADRWGLLHPEGLERELLRLSALTGRVESARQYAARLVERHPEDAVLLESVRALVSQAEQTAAVRG